MELHPPIWVVQHVQSFRKTWVCIVKERLDFQPIFVCTTQLQWLFCHLIGCSLLSTLKAQGVTDSKQNKNTHTHTHTHRERERERKEREREIKRDRTNTHLLYSIVCYLAMCVRKLFNTAWKSSDVWRILTFNIPIWRLGFNLYDF